MSRHIPQAGQGVQSHQYIVLFHSQYLQGTPM